MLKINARNVQENSKDNELWEMFEKESEENCEKIC